MARNKENDWFKEKWKGVPITPLNIDEHMSDIYKKTKGQYVTQGVSFNKDDSFQMGLLRQAILTHGTFSSFMKHLMHTYFIQQQQIAQLQQQPMSGMIMSYNNQVGNMQWSPDDSIKQQATQTEVEVEVEIDDEDSSTDTTDTITTTTTDSDDKKPRIDTTVKKNTSPTVTINKGNKSSGRRKGNPFLETID